MRNTILGASMAGVAAFLFLLPVTASAELCPLPSDTGILVAALWPMVDTDGDGAITLTEAQVVYPGVIQSDIDFIDANDDGVVQQSEFNLVFSIIPGGMVGYFDDNANGAFEYAEVASYVSPEQFDRVDLDGNDVFDCNDLGGLPGEGETSPVEGEGEVLTEGEPVVEACPLPDVAPMLIEVLFAVFDHDRNGRIYYSEIQRVSPELAALIDTYRADPTYGTIIDTVLLNGLDRSFVTLLLGLLGQDLLSYVDTNGDRLIQYSEVSENVPPEVWVYLDTNGNTVFDCEDYTRVTEPYAAAEGEEACGTLDMLALIVNGLVRFVDINNDGEITDLEVQVLAGDNTDIVYGILDSNSDGVITEAEVFDFLSSVPLNVVNVLDMNADGAIQDEEVSFVPALVFFALDANHDDVLDCYDALNLPDEGEGEAPPEGEGETDPDWGWLPFPDEDALSGDLVSMLRHMLAVLDTNGDDALSYEEVSAGTPLPLNLFEMLDADGDGLITWEELDAARESFEESPEETIIEVIRTITGLGEGNFYVPGMPFTVNLEIIRHGIGLTPELDLTEIIPEGWVIGTISDKSNAVVSVKSGGAGQELQFNWTNPLSFPIEVSYVVTPAADAKGVKTILGQAGFQNLLGDRIAGDLIATVLAELLDAIHTHTADTDHDWSISLRELLRVIQLFNSGGYHCAVDTEDGFAPGLPEIENCMLNHLADISADWVIDLPELLRVIQLYNSESGYYYVSDKTQDGFMIAPF